MLIPLNKGIIHRSQSSPHASLHDNVCNAVALNGRTPDSLSADFYSRFYSIAVEIVSRPLNLIGLHLTQLVLQFLSFYCEMRKVTETLNDGSPLHHSFVATNDSAHFDVAWEIVTGAFHKTYKVAIMFNGSFPQQTPSPSNIVARWWIRSKQKFVQFWAIVKGFLV